MSSIIKSIKRLEKWRPIEQWDKEVDNLPDNLRKDWEIVLALRKNVNLPTYLGGTKKQNNRKKAKKDSKEIMRKRVIALLNQDVSPTNVLLTVSSRASHPTFEDLLTDLNSPKVTRAYQEYMQRQLKIFAIFLDDDNFRVREYTSLNEACSYLGVNQDTLKLYLYDKKRSNSRYYVYTYKQWREYGKQVYRTLQKKWHYFRTKKKDGTLEEGATFLNEPNFLMADGQAFVEQEITKTIRQKIVKQLNNDVPPGTILNTLRLNHQFKDLIELIIYDDIKEAYQQYQERTSKFYVINLNNATLAVYPNDIATAKATKVSIKSIQNPGLRSRLKDYYIYSYRRWLETGGEVYLTIKKMYDNFKTSQEQGFINKRFVFKSQVVLPKYNGQLNREKIREKVITSLRKGVNEDEILQRLGLGSTIESLGQLAQQASFSNEYEKAKKDLNMLYAIDIKKCRVLAYDSLEAMEQGLNLSEKEIKARMRRRHDDYYIYRYVSYFQYGKNVFNKIKTLRAEFTQAKKEGKISRNASFLNYKTLPGLRG